MLLSPALGSSLAFARGHAFDPGRQITFETIAMHAPHSPKHPPKHPPLLACLSAEDYQHLPPHLERIPIRALPDRVQPLAVSIQD